MGSGSGHRNIIARTPAERLAWLQERLRILEGVAAARRKNAVEAEREVELLRAEIEEQKARVAAESEPGAAI